MPNLSQLKSILIMQNKIYYRDRKGCKFYGNNAK